MSTDPRSDDGRPDRRRAETTADTCFELLGSWQRRFVLLSLERGPTPVTLQQLARALAAEHDRLTVEDARLRLYHLHLPKLAAAGLVAYDRSTETVSRPATAEPSETVGHVDAAVGELAGVTGADR